MRRAVALPLIATGGITTAADVAGALGAGAQAVMVGTVLLRTHESGASAPHQAALVDPAFDTTVVTHAFTGRPARPAKPLHRPIRPHRPDRLPPSTTSRAPSARQPRQSETRASSTLGRSRSPPGQSGTRQRHPRTTRPQVVSHSGRAPLGTGHRTRHVRISCTPERRDRTGAAPRPP
ncbi:nitronate monooxygenase [Streptomyces sp. NPDC055506]